MTRSSSKRLWKRLFRLFLLLLIVAGAAGWYLYPRLTQKEAPTVLTVAAKVGNVEETVLATGILKPVKLVAVGAQVSGRVTSIDVGVGDQVAEGDRIASIDSTNQQNALKTAQASLSNVRAQLEEKKANLAYAETNLERQTRLLDQNATSRNEYETAVETLATTKAQIAALEAQISEAEVAVETARVDLGYTQITAPIAGTVLWVVTQEGQTVNAAQSAPTIVILGQVDTMTVRAEISEVDVVKAEPGQRVWFTILGDPSKRYETTLGSIEPAPESITTDSAVTTSVSSASSSGSSEAIYYNGIFDVPNPDGRLRTYMTAEVHIVVGEATDVVTIPSAALARRNPDGTYQVRVLAPDGSIADRRVEIGLNNGVTAEVVSGIEAGDEIVTGEMSGATAADGRRRPSPMGF
ncbi:efflux RND transporter periplasmic adaptor subunit [Amorphus sp. 3PC139-8]|uniref:efflux RND transporter periplasmic adaptor subunit n=1 Tax=Amorphus sp. 3PC139-8 TaxID=2735676 RepID=UPI00345D9667